ncbi:MAG: hypothetical protein ACR2QU_10280 [Gammaproteobacteria bacterium]
MFAATAVVIFLAMRSMVPVEIAGNVPPGTNVSAAESHLQRLNKTRPSISIDLPRYDQLKDEALAWREKRGYYDVASEHPDYAAYSDERLISLAAESDRLATSLLAQRSRVSAPLKAIEWYLGASIQGSTMATLAIGEIYERIATIGGIPTGAKASQGDLQLAGVQDAVAMTEALAWAHVTEMRGDPYGSVLRDRLLDSYLIDAGQRARACAMAKRHHEVLELTRSERRLPALDNSPPPITEHPFLPGLGCEDWPFERPVCAEVLVGRTADSVVKVASAYSCKNL